MHHSQSKETTGQDVPFCLVVNHSQIILKSVLGATISSAKEQINITNALEIIICVEPHLESLPLLAEQIRNVPLTIAICAPDCPPTYRQQLTECFDGLVQSQPTLYISLIRDLVEVRSRSTLISIDLPDIHTMFKLSQGRISYKRVMLDAKSIKEELNTLLSSNQDQVIGLFCIMAIEHVTSFTSINDVIHSIQAYDNISLLCGSRHVFGKETAAVGLLWFESFVKPTAIAHLP